MEIRSYRRVFDLERRIYRVDRLRLNPAGVPVRGIIYFLAILAAAILAGRLPLLGAMAGTLPWYMRDLALPGASAALLTLVRVEGRPFHLAAHAVARYRAGPRRLVGARAAIDGRWYPQEIVMLPDGSDAPLRRLRYTGPGAVLIAVEHEHLGRPTGRTPAALDGWARRPAVVLRALSEGRPLPRGRVVVLARGARLIVRGDAARRR